MSKITWDQSGQRFYENGVSQGVLYCQDCKGVAWNGLISVEVNSVDEADPVHMDGIKYTDIQTLGDFEGKITAFTYPDRFLEFEGFQESPGGLFMSSQPKDRFGLSYRTEISNDHGASIGYKIHLLYNLLAIPADKTYETLSLDTEPAEFEWDLTAVPEEVDGFRPTAYVISDSRKIDPHLLADIEDILYGDDDTDGVLPDLNGFVTYVRKWGRLIITDNGDGTWTADSPIEGMITMLDSTTFEITADTAVYLDAETYTISSSDKNEEDIWPL